MCMKKSDRQPRQGKPIRRPPPRKPARRKAAAPPDVSRGQEAPAGAMITREIALAMLSDHAAQNDRQARTLASRSEELIAMLFAPAEALQKEKKAPIPPDPSAILDLVTRLSRLHASYAGEMRKNIDLLARLTRPRTPDVRVVAAGQQVNIGAAQQVNNSGDV